MHKTQSTLLRLKILLIMTILSALHTVMATEGNGETLYKTQCVSCHGIKGEGNQALQSPSIAGLSESYLIRQLTHFKNDVRGADTQDVSGSLMAAIATPLSEKNIQSVSQYLANQPFSAAAPSDKSAGFLGAGLFRNCQSCHGAKAQGEEALFAPRLAGQHTWYLKKQLANFKQGIRGNHENDALGKQMVDIALGLTDEKQIDLILIHISKLTPVIQDDENSH